MAVPVLWADYLLQRCYPNRREFHNAQSWSKHVADVAHCTKDALNLQSVYITGKSEHIISDRCNVLMYHVTIYDDAVLS